jgi:hypothetical protein
MTHETEFIDLDDLDDLDDHGRPRPRPRPRKAPSVAAIRHQARRAGRAPRNAPIAPHRCGAASRNGEPCQQAVHTDGARCRRHEQPQNIVVPAVDDNTIRFVKRGRHWCVSVPANHYVAGARVIAVRQSGQQRPIVLGPNVDADGSRIIALFTEAPTDISEDTQTVDT